MLVLGLGLWCLTPLSTIFQLYRGGCWPYYHESFEYDFRTHTQKPANQKVICNKYSVLIGGFWSKSAKIMLKCFKGRVIQLMTSNTVYCNNINFHGI